MYRDRAQAGARLLERLPPLDPAETVVIALPRGGAPVAEVIARSLGAPLDLALVRKVGLPGHRELALAAVTDGDNPQITINRDVARHARLTDEEIMELAKPELAEIDRRRALYFGERPRPSVKGKTVLVVDDGIATGSTARAALALLRAQEPARLILAVPVAPVDILSEIDREVDDVICLSSPSPFIAVGAHYLNFDQVDDRTVIEILERANAPN